MFEVSYIMIKLEIPKGTFIIENFYLLHSSSHAQSGSICILNNELKTKLKLVPNRLPTVLIVESKMACMRLQSKDKNRSKLTVKNRTSFMVEILIESSKAENISNYKIHEVLFMQVEPR